MYSKIYKFYDNHKIYNYYLHSNLLFVVFYFYKETSNTKKSFIQVYQKTMELESKIHKIESEAKKEIKEIKNNRYQDSPVYSISYMSEPKKDTKYKYQKIDSNFIEPYCTNNSEKKSSEKKSSERKSSERKSSENKKYQKAIIDLDIDIVNIKDNPRDLLNIINNTSESLESSQLNDEAIKSITKNIKSCSK